MAVQLVLLVDYLLDLFFESFWTVVKKNICMYYMCTCNITNNTFTYNNGFVTEFTKNINMYTQIKSKRISLKMFFVSKFVCGKGWRGWGWC